MRWLFLVLAVALAGCYETNHEVIPPSAGIRAPVESPITWDEGGETHFSYVPATKDYRFREEDGRTGSVRAIHIRDDIYLTQVRYDDENVYGLFFFQITPTRLDIVYPVGDIETVATRHGVELEEDFVIVDYILHGPPQNIYAFLSDHAQFRFETDE